MAINKITRLENSHLFRPIYKALINNGNTYAGFNFEQLSSLIGSLSPLDTIIDPMAGYGNTMQLCSKMGYNSFSVEMNPPSYLWSSLFLPNRRKIIIETIDLTIKASKHLPSISSLINLSDKYFHNDTINLIIELFYLIKKNVEINVSNDKLSSEIAIAILLPFTGRISNSVPGNVVTHVKEGGYCILKNWSEDFLDYLHVIKKKIDKPGKSRLSNKHIIKIGNSCIFNFPERRFNGMITSPPYPNGRDYSLMFAPENYLLTVLDKEKILHGYVLDQKIIGSVYVSGTHNVCDDDIRKLCSPSAQEFLFKILNYRGGKNPKQAEYDNKVYYLRYYYNYFKNLEVAYRNIEKALSLNFEGYIVVVNNTSRGYIVPVAESILDLWGAMGYSTSVDEERSSEKNHFGAINPRAKGIRARHKEYVLHIKK